MLYRKLQAIKHLNIANYPNITFVFDNNKLQVGNFTESNLHGLRMYVNGSHSEGVVNVYYSDFTLDNDHNKYNHPGITHHLNSLLHVNNAVALENDKKVFTAFQPHENKRVMMDEVLERVTTIDATAPTTTGKIKTYYVTFEEIY